MLRSQTPGSHVAPPRGSFVNWVREGVSSSVMWGGNTSPGSASEGINELMLLVTMTT